MHTLLPAACIRRESADSIQRSSAYRKRIYRFLWELHYYNFTGDPSGHSLTQRFEYWKAAVSIIQQHPVEIQSVC